jgi:hypothetical protein
MSLTVAYLKNLVPKSNMAKSRPKGKFLWCMVRLNEEMTKRLDLNDNEIGGIEINSLKDQRGNIYVTLE